MDGGVSRAYPDTSFVLAPALQDWDKETAIHTLSRARGGAFDLVLLQLVLGEAVAVIAKKVPDYDGRTECLRRLHQVISDSNIDVLTCLPSAPAEACRIRLELRTVDERLDDADSSILSAVLADRRSKFLITRDQMLLGNRKVVEFEQWLREEDRGDEKLKIRNSV